MIWNFIKRFAREEEGVTAIEYGLIAALIAVVIIVAVDTIGDELTTTFNCVHESLTAGGKGASCP